MVVWVDMSAGGERKEGQTSGDLKEPKNTENAFRLDSILGHRD